MVVNSYGFIIFFVAFFVVYFLPVVRRNVKAQNCWTMMASLAFYAIADWRMTGLLIASIALFFILGIWLRRQMDKGNEKNAAWITRMAVVIGIAILAVFKYLGFFADSIAALLKAMGINVAWHTVNILVPVGVSFFAFKLISYIIEIHRGKITQQTSFVDFATYIAFFPTILSGPIDRPEPFLTQIRKPRSIKYKMAVDGCRQILWGVFVKMCIADNMSFVIDNAWNEGAYAPGALNLVVALMYPIALYADFAGYSDMAIGVAKILGIRVARNFNHPLLARNMAEYWRRWHISLTSWITDYVFMPLNIAMRDIGRWGTTIAVIINLVVIGLWHGANWTFAIFGLYHGLLFIPLIFSGTFGKNKKIKPYDLHIKHYNIALPKGKDLLMMIGTYLLVVVGHIIFRATDISAAITFTQNICSTSFFDFNFVTMGKVHWFMVCLFVILEWTHRQYEHPLQAMDYSFLKNYRIIRWAIYYLLILLMLRYQGEAHQFIYFNF